MTIELLPDEGLEESTPITEFYYGEECPAKSEWAYESWEMARDGTTTLTEFDQLIIELFGMEWRYWERTLKLLSSECIRGINKRVREGPPWIDKLEESEHYDDRRTRLHCS